MNGGGRVAAVATRCVRWQVSFQLRLDTVLVGHLPLDAPICVEPESSVRSVLSALVRQRGDSVLVCRANRMLGIFTERDALRMMAMAADLEVAISQAMTSSPAKLSKHDSLATAIQTMSRGGYRRLPVVDEALVPLGVLKTSHILHYLAEHFPKIIYNLPPAPHHAARVREGA